VRPFNYLSLRVAGFPSDEPVLPSWNQGTGGVALNTTVDEVTGDGYVEVYDPSSHTSLSGISNLNLHPGRTVANLVFTSVSAPDGIINMANVSPGRTQFIGDIQGIFTNEWF
jgi:hypothetical protein